MLPMIAISALLVSLALFAGPPPAVEAEESDPGEDAGMPLLLGDTRGEYPLGPHLEILADPAGQWTVEEVSADSLSRRFVSARQFAPQIATPPMWFRFTVKNQSQNSRWLFEEKFLSPDRIDLFVPAGSAASPIWTHKSTGGYLPSAEEKSRQAQLRAQTAELQARVAEQELQTARALQMGLMPTVSLRVEGFDLAGRCLPATHVGGDFFQYFERDGTLSLCLADVTGHAMQAAVPVMMFSGVLETEMQYGHPVERLLAQLNRLLCHKLASRTFVCFAFGEIHLATRTLRLANGGCPYPYHYQAATGEVTELLADAYPLGVHPESLYPVVEAQLAPGDRIVFCSDGLAETRNEPGEMFGFNRLAETIRQGCADDLPAAGLIDQLITVLQAFAGSTSQEDDMTCVVLRVGELS